LKSEKKDDGFIVYVDDIIPVFSDVAKSTTEAEYLATSSNTRSIIYIQKLLYVYYLLITLTCSAKAELRRAQLNRIKSLRYSQETAIRKRS